MQDMQSRFRRQRQKVSTEWNDPRVWDPLSCTVERTRGEGRRTIERTTMSEIPAIAERSAVKMYSRARRFGGNVSGDIPGEAPGVFDLASRSPRRRDGSTLDLREIWALAAPLLVTRDNDGHTLGAVAIAASLLDARPESDPAIVLPAMMLHDVGWSQVPDDEILGAIAPGGGAVDRVRMHEIEGARLAREILEQVGHDAEAIERIAEIIDGHDTRLEALSIEDAIVKDSDKTWRVSPHGLDVVMEWFGLDRAEALRLCASRVVDHLFTDEARALSRGLIALGSAGMWPEFLELDRTGRAEAETGVGAQ